MNEEISVEFECARARAMAMRLAVHGCMWAQFHHGHSIPKKRMQTEQLQTY